MENYTRPNDPEHEDTIDDFRNGMLLMTRALGFALGKEEGAGIVFDLTEHIENPFGTSSNQLIAYSSGKQLRIIDCPPGFKPGDFLTVHEPNK